MGETLNKDPISTCVTVRGGPIEVGRTESITPFSFTVPLSCVHRLLSTVGFPPDSPNQTTTTPLRHPALPT